MENELKPHPLAECFPMLPDSELQELADDIKANGLRQNIIVYEGKILDGRNRYAACQIAGIQSENFITLYEGSDPIGFVISANLIRRHLGVGTRAIIAAELATATVGGDHSTNSTNGVSVAQVAKQMDIGTTSIGTARRILKADQEVAADVKAGKISLNEGAKRAGVAKKEKPAKNLPSKKADSSEVPDTKAKSANTSDAESKEVPVVDATSKKEKLRRSFWKWIESQDPDNRLALEVALQEILAQMDLGDLAIAGALKQIVVVMDLQDLKEMVALRELEEADARTDVGVPSASGPEIESASSESKPTDNVVEFPAVGVDTTVTTPKPSRKTPAPPALTKEAQIITMLKKELNALKAAGTLTQESQTERDNLVTQIRNIEHCGFEFWEKNYGTPAPVVSDQPVENHKHVEPGQPVATKTAEMEISMAQETGAVQPVRTKTVETKTVRELTREKLERALVKSGNPRSLNVDEILTALEKKGWDIRKRQEQTLANTLANCPTVEALMKVFANNAKKIVW
jgi:ParB-like nuclease domain